MIFYAAEIQAYVPGTTAVSYAYAWGGAPWGALTELPAVLGAAATLTASDIGYRTAPSDPGGPVPYPPIVAEAFAINRALNLDPTSSAIAAAWGSINLSNADQGFDAIAATWNNGGRPARVLSGSKTLDATRGIFMDPAYSTLTPVFSGVSTPWLLTEAQLQIPLRDATYWLEQPLQTAQYTGAGGYAGTASLTGTPIPKTRGAVSNVTPVLIDPANLIYQYSDGPGTVTALYEGAAANHTFQADTTNLYAGSTTAGNYRTDNSRGLFQLGSSPIATITVDCTGAFPVAGLKSVAADIARYLLSEDLALPSANLNAASFTAAAAAYPYAAGVHFAPSDTVNGVDGVDRVLSGFGAKLFPARDGTLHLLVLRVPGATPADTYTPLNAVSITPTTLPAALSPPPYRIRVGYQHNYTVQTSGFIGAATAARQQFSAAADRLAGAVSASVMTSYARPNDLPAFGTSLVSQTNAQTVANDLLALWGVRRRLYAVVLPIAVGIVREIGDTVRLVWPMDDLAGGQIGIVVGDAFRSGDATITLTVLV